MKCDELKDYDYDPDFPFQSRGRFYDADEVDAAIDELKSTHHKERHEYIDMVASKDKEIAEIKQQYNDMDIANTVHIAKMNARIAQLEDDVAFWKAKAKGEM